MCTSLNLQTKKVLTADYVEKGERAFHKYAC